MIHFMVRSIGREPAQVCREVAIVAVIVVLISASLLVSISSSSLALETQNGDNFVFQKDKSSGLEIAASQSELSFNFFDVGDLSIYSLYLVQQVLGEMSSATERKVDRNLKKSLIAIFHDTKVFSRLKSERQSFVSLGIPDEIIADLKNRVTDDAKCLSMTRTDDKNDIVFTIILLSEKFDSCLISGLINSFGLRSSTVNVRTLIDACVLYQGRRLGLRDRQGLLQETSRLRDLCLTKAGEAR